MLIGNAGRARGQRRARRTSTQAEALVLQLDTRASELKVDGFKAIVREDPTEQLSELADDIATPEGLLAELDTIPLTGESAEAVAGLEESYRGVHGRHHGVHRRAPSPTRPVRGCAGRRSRPPTT